MTQLPGTGVKPQPNTIGATPPNTSRRKLITAILLASIALGAMIAPLFIPSTGSARWLLPIAGIIGGANGWHVCHTVTRWRISVAVSNLQITHALVQALRQRQQPKAPECSTSPSFPTSAPDISGMRVNPTGPSLPAESPASTTRPPAPPSNDSSADPAPLSPST